MGDGQAGLGGWPGRGVSARGSRGGFLRDLNALRLDASANNPLYNPL